MTYLTLKDFQRIKYFKPQNIEIKKANIYLITGINGSGKTSILKLFSELLRKRLVDKGIFIKQSKSIAYTINIEELPKEIKAKSLINLYKDLDFDFSRLFNLPDKLIKNMSMGMKQKLSLILALSQNKNIYMLDEIDNYLDKKSFEILLLIIDAYQKVGKTFLIATHNALKYESLNNIVWQLNV